LNNNELTLDQNPKVKKISAIIFDLDGTLINSYPGIKSSINSAINTILPGRYIPNLKSKIGPTIREIFHNNFEDISKDELDLLVGQFRRHYDQEGCYQAKVYPNVIKILKTLNRKEIICCIATNKPTIPTINILEKFHITDSFKYIICRDSQSQQFLEKKEMVAILLERLNLPPNQILMLGDMIEDAVAAEFNGISFIAASYGFGINLSTSGHTINANINSILELLDIINIKV